MSKIEYNGKELNEREIMLLGIQQIVMSFNDEDMIGPWLSLGVPDGADTEEILDMANDDEDFRYCVSLFMSLMRMKRVYEDGLFLGRELGVVNADTWKEM